MDNENIKINVVKASKSFNNHSVLNDVNLICKTGQICGVIGRNGSGKTVLFKTICGFLKLDKGQIFIDGIDRQRKLEMLTNSGVIIEEPAFLRNQSGIKNLEFLYQIRNKKNKEHLEKVMKTVGLDPKSKKRVSNYSLGMKQRLAIAQAIMEDQEILILDEPMNGLDNQGVREMRELFKGLKDKGKTILLASHNKEDIDILCDTVYEMDNGVISKIR